MQWGNEWTDLPAPPVELLHKPCGERVSARVVCSHCREDIDVHDTEPVVGRGLMIQGFGHISRDRAQATLAGGRP